MLGSDEELTHPSGLKHAERRRTRRLAAVVVAQLALQTGLAAEKSLDCDRRAVRECSSKLVPGDLPASIFEIHEIRCAYSSRCHANDLTVSIGIVRLDHFDA